MDVGFYVWAAITIVASLGYCEAQYKINRRRQIEEGDDLD